MYIEDLFKHFLWKTFFSMKNITAYLKLKKIFIIYSGIMTSYFSRSKDDNKIKFKKNMRWKMWERKFDSKLFVYLMSIPVGSEYYAVSLVWLALCCIYATLLSVIVFSVVYTM